MLKICDDVDLKELEKYEFEYKSWREQYVCGNYNREIYLFIKPETRELKVGEPFRDNEETENNIDTLYDLIKDDLVEKVKE